MIMFAAFMVVPIIFRRFRGVRVGEGGPSYRGGGGRGGGGAGGDRSGGGEARGKW